MADWTALLPCPFCNGPAKLLSQATSYNPEIGSNATVVCMNSKCGAGGPCIEDTNIERPLEVMNRHAIRLWNRRGNHTNAEWKLQRIAQILGSNYIEPVQSGGGNG